MSVATQHFRTNNGATLARRPVRFWIFDVWPRAEPEPHKCNDYFVLFFLAPLLGLPLALDLIVLVQPAIAIFCEREIRLPF